MLLYVADDYIEFAMYCAQVARREGWTVEVAQNDSDLLDKLRQGKEPALILCDIQMPKMDGIEVEQKLPKINRKLRVRFKARTEYATDRLLLDGFVFPNGKIEPLMDSDPRNLLRNPRRYRNGDRVPSFEVAKGWPKTDARLPYNC